MSNELSSQLFNGVASKDVEATKTALAAGASPKIIARIQGTPFRLIHFAAAGGHAGIVETLLSAGADIEARDAMGTDFTPLLVAANMGNADVVKTLITLGANKEAAECQQGMRAIHLASITGRDAVIQVLLQAGADKDALDFEGTSALHYAAREGHDRVVELLLAAAADRNVLLHGETALNTARHYGHQSTVKLLSKP